MKLLGVVHNKPDVLSDVTNSLRFDLFLSATVTGQNSEKRLLSSAKVLLNKTLKGFQTSHTLRFSPLIVFVPGPLLRRSGPQRDFIINPEIK